jgi:septal ring factor EnvC (AmiA/AmiB activator)
MRLFRSDTTEQDARFGGSERPPLRRPAALIRATKAASATVAIFAAAVAGAQLNQTLQAQMEVDRAAAQSQQRIEQIRDQTLDAASRYAQAMTEAESYEQYNEQLEAQVRSQQEEIASIQQQLLDIEQTNREVQPLMDKMVRALEQFVRLDVPFLIEERTARVNNLKNILARADVSISEKYRLILEAYQIELEYGRTLEAYEGTLNAGDTPRTVTFVRLGRISLMYRTLDGSETGYWDQNQKQWVVDNSYAEAVDQALRVANQEGAPELLTVPVPAPQEIQS